MKKICFVVSTPFTVLAFLRTHVSELSKHVDVHLVAKLDGFDQSLLSDFPFVTVHNIKIERGIDIFADFLCLIRLYRHFKSSNYDAVHCITPKAGLLGILAARLAGINHRIHIFTGQVWHTKRGGYRLLLKCIDKLISINATTVLVDGESQRRFLVEENIFIESKARVLGRGSISGVDVSRFSPNQLIRNQLRIQLGISNSEIVFMYLGRMNRDKGLIELSRAFNHLLSIRPDVKLIIAGPDEGNLRSEIEAIVTSKGKVLFTGHVSRPEDILQVCDVFCLPSHREGFGTSVIEASAMGKPIICSDTYGLAETIVEGKTGIRHKVGDAQSLYQCMFAMVDNPDQMNLMGSLGRDYVIQYFDSRVITREWVDFYRRLLNV